LRRIGRGSEGTRPTPIVLDEKPDDPSHSLIKDYDEALNDQVAEELQKVIIAAYPPPPKS
jgi:hypothetical protein